MQLIDDDNNLLHGKAWYNKMNQIYNTGANGTDKIMCYYWASDVATRGIVYFAHGVTEYALRHEKFIEHLVANGFAVCANDHMGHGKSKNDHPMYFAGNDGMSGWHCACEDAYNCIKEAKEMFGEDYPVYGIGFSLGSFMVRTLAIQHPDLFKAMVLLGTGDQSAIEIALAKFIAKSECKKHGEKTKTEQITNLTFGAYNAHFEGDTRADWLCANRASLYTYLGDMECGDAFTAGLFLDLLEGMEQTGKKENITLMDKDMPILMLSGERDAVGNFTKGVIALQKKYEKIGMKNVETKFFRHMRHDVLHETHAADVFDKVADFLLHN